MKTKVLLKYIAFIFLGLNMLPCKVYAGPHRSGQSRKESIQTKHAAIVQAKKQEDVQFPTFSTGHGNLNPSLFTKGLVFLLATGLIMLPVVEAGVLDHKLSPVLEKATNVMQKYEDFSKEHPMAITGGKLLGKCGIGAGIGFMASGPVGALPGCFVGTTEGITSELQGFVVEKLGGEQIQAIINAGATRFAPILQSLDKTIDQDLAIKSGKLLAATAISGIQTAKTTNHIFHSKPTIGYEGFHATNIIKELKASPLKFFGDAVTEEIKTGHGIKHGLMHTLKEELRLQNEHMPSPQFATHSMPFQQPQSSSFEFKQTGQKPNILKNNQQFMQNWANQQLKRQNSNPLRIPYTNSIDAINNKAPYTQDYNYDGSGKGVVHLSQNQAAMFQPPSIYIPNMPSCDECVQWALNIDNNVDYYKKVAEKAKEYSAQIGDIDFPSIPNTNFRCYDIFALFEKSYEEIVNLNRQTIAEYKNFIDTFDQKVQEFDNRVQLYNKKVTMCNELPSLMKKIRPLMGSMHNLQTSFKWSMNFLNQKGPIECPKLPYLNIDYAHSHLIYLKMVLEHVRETRKYSTAYPQESISTEAMAKTYLEMFKTNAQAIPVARSVLQHLEQGYFSATIKKQATELLKQEAKGSMTPPDFANALAQLIVSTLKTYAHYNDLFAQLDVVERGFISCGIAHKTKDPHKKEAQHKTENSHERKDIDPFWQNDSNRLLCSSTGRCGIDIDTITNSVLPLIVATKNNLEKAHALFAQGYPLQSAQDLLNFIRPQGSYIGNPYLCEIGNDMIGCSDESKAHIRAVDGGHEEAQAIFDFFAEDLPIREANNIHTGASYKKVTLNDKTQITFIPAQKETDESVITITDIPSWILNEKIELHFAPQKNNDDSSFMNLAKKLTLERQLAWQELVKTIESLPKENYEKLDSLLKEFIKDYETEEDV